MGPLPRIAVAACALLAAPLSAQEQVYVTQRSPARIHAFHLSGGSWVRNDLTPADGATQALPSGLDPVNGMATTDRLFAVGAGFTGLGVDVIDPFTGVELPRVRTSVIGGKPVLSADGQWAFLVGPNPAQSAALSVVDLDPASAGFLTERAALTGLATGQAGSSAQAVALVGTTLYAALIDGTGAAGFAPNVKIVAIDVGNPLAPSVLAATVVAQSLTPAPPASASAAALRAFTLSGTTYLFLCRRDLVILRPEPDGSVVRVGQVASSRATAPAGRRFLRDVHVAEVAGQRRAFVAADVSGPAGLGAAEELLVVNLDTFSDDQAGTSVFSSRTLAVPGSSDFDQVRASLDGTRVYVMSQGQAFPAEIAQLHSVDITATVDESTAVATIAVDGTTSVATGLEVHPGVAPAPAAAIGGVSVSGASPANVLVNDQARTLTVAGSGLAGTSHVFVGLDRLSLGVASDTSVQATSPPLLPAGDRPLVVVGSNGGIAAFGPPEPSALAVVNAPTFQPPEVVYALANSENKAFIVHAANETQVLASFGTGPGPGRAIVTPDGALLFTSNFLGANVEAYSLLEDAARGWAFYEKVADLHVGGFPQALVMKRDGSRIYVTTVDGYVAVVDSSARPPVLVDIDADPFTTDVNVDPALSPGLSRIPVAIFDGFGNADSAPRGLALSADDKWLYGARGNDPHLVAVHVDDDLVVAADVTFVAIPSLPGLPPPPNFGRSDLVVRGSRLYFASAVENPPLLRLFDVSGASISPAATPSLAFPAGAAASVRTFGLTPDGAFLYASSRTPGSDPQGSSVYVLDAATDTWVKSLALGAFADVPVPSPTGNYAYVASAERDVVFTLEARPGPRQHTPIGASGGGLGTGGLAVNPGQVTPAGVDVSVAPAPNVALTFSSITAAGHTTVTSLNATTVTTPEGFQVLNVVGNPVYYEIRTTASFVLPVKVCLTYTDAQVEGVDEATLRLMHEEGGTFVDRTIGAPDTDPAANRICGSVSSFSQFTIAVRTGARSLCSLLGREFRPRGKDKDLFEFSGDAGERVVLTLAEQPDPANAGEEVRLVLRDAIRGTRLVERERGALPLTIEATLPDSGRYVVRVERRTGRRGFLGHYCLTLQSSADAFTTFAATVSVEP